MVSGAGGLWRGSRDHLAEVGESYGAHLRFAALVGAMLVAAGMACLLHALVPALCRDTASRTIVSLNRLLRNRSALAEVEAGSEAAVAFALLVLLGVAATAALWIAGAAPAVGAPVTLLAFAFPAGLIATDRDLAG